MYQVKIFSLAAIKSEVQTLMDRDAHVTEVIVNDMPAGAKFKLHFGETGDGITITEPTTFQPTGDDADKGVFWTNAVAQAGVSVEIVIATGGGAPYARTRR